jgi:two-component system cell cycle sensor histidine kinase/response regulator CckA
MNESSGTKAELKAEIADLKEKIRKLETAEARHRQAESQRKAALAALGESEDRAHKQRIAIARLALDNEITSADMPTAMRRLTEEAAAAIQVERASVWLLSEADEALRCIALFETKTRKHSAGAILKSKDYPRYFAAIRAESMIYVGDARSDPRTSKFSAGYLVPLGITSMLDAGIQIENKLAGVVCFEHVGAKRAWHSDEEAFACTIAAIAAQIFANAERKLAEAALKESENKYRELVENSPDAIAIYVAGKIVFANKECLHLLAAASSADLIGKSVIHFVHPDFRALVSERMKKFANERTVSPLSEEKFIRLDGSSVEVEVMAMPIRFENKPAVQLIIRNISARKQAEAEKRVLEERLQWAGKMESIGTLAGGIAHDFNNLLMGIQGYASMTLINLDPAHPNYERLKRIEAQVQSGADLTRQLLGFARGGRYEIKPVDMNDIIEKTSSMFGRTRKEITIHFTHGKDLCSVEVDRGQIEQVLLNLYVNAWQAMPGGGEIRLQTENVLLPEKNALPYSVQPGKYVKISVTDTGTGMDEKTRERIFDPFFTTKTLGRGTGLGLATVYGIIKGHQGMINVYSELGHGTTFNIYLPASDKEVVKAEPATAKITSGTETILLIEDEKLILEVSRELLESIGYKVYAAGSGQAGIDVFREKRNEIDLVILDMIMPGIAGGEVFDRLRKIDPAIKVLLSSGYSLNGEAQHIMDRGCNGFLQKPFQIEILSRKIREILET